MIKLKEVRKQKKLTQKQIAEILNVTQAQICRIEKGENDISGEQIILICKALNISADYLLGLKKIY